MDSMRSLNTSLPSARPAPPEALLQAFRTAALSVTNLYKSAVTDQNASRQMGYQEALADILTFLDKENLGLQDGEGWRVRQWATERYDGSALPQQIESDDHDDRSESEQRPRSVTPTREQQVDTSTEPSETPRTERTAPNEDSSCPATQDQPAPNPIFYFSGNTASASADDMQTDEDGHQSTDGHGSLTTNNTTRVPSGASRSNRAPVKGGNQRHATRSSTKEFTFNAGTKRKFQIPDFFDISNIGPRDGTGGSKRGRLS
jgi:hypothetical protein